MYTSPCKDCESQVTTVPRKLSIMRVTPMVTETAIMRAAMAMAVRLSDCETLRGAMRPSGPNRRGQRARGQPHDDPRELGRLHSQADDDAGDPGKGQGEAVLIEQKQGGTSEQQGDSGQRQAGGGAHEVILDAGTTQGAARLDMRRFAGGRQGGGCGGGDADDKTFEQAGELAGRNR